MSYRIAFYGGSFNPPHVGHAIVASWVKWTNLADEVWLCPAADHPFGKKLLQFETRMELCQALCDDINNGFISTHDVEANVPHEVSYTYLTLAYLRDQHPEYVFHPVMGADVLQDTAKWKFWDELVNEFPPIFVGREGYPATDSPTFPNVSSTLIRSHVVNNRPIDGLVTKGVKNLIEEMELYL